jgi:hypothetical protein
MGLTDYGEEQLLTLMRECGFHLIDSSDLQHPPGIVMNALLAVCVKQQEQINELKHALMIYTPWEDSDNE